MKVRRYRPFSRCTRPWAPAAAFADDSDKIEARVGAWGRNCKNAIDAGEISLADIKRSGLSYNFRVHHMPGKDPSGYCNTDGEGNVDERNAVH